MRAAFLEGLRSGLSVSGAAKAAGTTRTAVYKFRERYPTSDFAKSWDAAMEAGTDHIEDEALRRAVEGVLEPVYQGKELVGHVRKFSDKPISDLLKNRRGRRNPTPIAVPAVTDLKSILDVLSAITVRIASGELDIDAANSLAALVEAQRKADRDD
jgi:hypothetical protein